MSDPNDVPIRLFPSRGKYANLDTQDETQVAEIIRKEVLPNTKADYYRVDVKIKRRDQAPKYLIAYLLRKDIYLAEVVRVDLESDYSSANVTWDYDDSEEKEEDEDTEPGPSSMADEEGYAGPYDFVASTPVPEISTARAAVENLHSLFTSLGFRSRMLKGPEATVATYKELLSSGLKGFVNIGHGNPNGIALYDGALNAAWFNAVANQALKPGVVYFNSCQVHNSPLEPAVMKAGARTFIGGNVNLAIGPSEAVCQCFWNNILNAGQHMGATLTQCEKDKYPTQGAHGISGDTGPFFNEVLHLAHAMWIHGHSIQIEYPDRISKIWRAGFFAHIEGKAGTNNWFHFAIPTPVIVDSRRLRVGSVLLVFRTKSADAAVNSIHVYDGDRKIVEYNGLNLTGELGMRRFDVPAHPSVVTGVGISIGVGFGVEMMSHCMEFIAAGCDFVS